MECACSGRQLHELAHVEGPVVEAQALDEIGRKRNSVQSRPRAKEAAKERHDFFPALAQRGKKEFDAAEPRIEIGAESAQLDVVMQRTLRRTHDARVGFLAFALAERHDRMLF